LRIQIDSITDNCYFQIVLTPSDDWDLSELSLRADISIRTIRFYQQQFLLDAPGRRGHGARYGEADLRRLQLIKALQREHLPLAEIRSRLETLDPDGVSQALEDLSRTRKSAAAYAQRVRLGLKDDASPSSGLGALAAEPAPHPPSRAMWERIPLAPGIELHVRRPLAHFENRQVSRLVDLATRLFNKEDDL